MLRLEVLTPEMERLAPVLCGSLSGMPFTLAGGTALAFECLLAGVRCGFFSFRPRFEPASVSLHGMPLAPVLDIAAMKLRDLLLTAEFLAREGRIGVEEKDDACIP